MNKHINHNLTHCCYTIDPKYTVLVHCTPHVQVSNYLINNNYMCDEALTPARFSCICHMREPFNEPFIVGNPWSVALHLPPVGHNTEIF